LCPVLMCEVAHYKSAACQAACCRLQGCGLRSCGLQAAGCKEGSAKLQEAGRVCESCPNPLYLDFAEHAGPYVCVHVHAVTVSLGLFACVIVRSVEHDEQSQSNSSPSQDHCCGLRFQDTVEVFTAATGNTVKLKVQCFLPGPDLSQCRLQSGCSVEQHLLAAGVGRESVGRVPICMTVEPVVRLVLFSQFSHLVMKASATLSRRDLRIGLCGTADALASFADLCLRAKSVIQPEYGGEALNASSVIETVMQYIRMWANRPELADEEVRMQMTTSVMMLDGLRRQLSVSCRTARQSGSALM
jgi:hypothetical protein